MPRSRCIPRSKSRRRSVSAPRKRKPVPRKKKLYTVDPLTRDDDEDCDDETPLCFYICCFLALLFLLAVLGLVLTRNPTVRRFLPWTSQDTSDLEGQGPSTATPDDFEHGALSQHPDGPKPSKGWLSSFYSSEKPEPASTDHFKTSTPQEVDGNAAAATAGGGGGLFGGFFGGGGSNGAGNSGGSDPYQRGGSASAGKDGAGNSEGSDRNRWGGSGSAGNDGDNSGAKPSEGKAGRGIFGGFFGGGGSDGAGNSDGTDQKGGGPAGNSVDNSGGPGGNYRDNSRGSGGNYGDNSGGSGGKNGENGGNGMGALPLIGGLAGGLAGSGAAARGGSAGSGDPNTDGTGTSGPGGADSSGQGNRGSLFKGTESGDENYSSCGSGAYIFRVFNFPPFRGQECDHGTHLILENGNIVPDRFWKFHPVGDVEIHLINQIQVTGFTLMHPPDQEMATIPKEIEFYGVVYEPNNYQRQETLLGQYTYTNFNKGRHKFLVQKASKLKFEVVRLRFLNSQTNSEFVHVYRVQVHGVS